MMLIVQGHEPLHVAEARTWLFAMNGDLAHPGRTTLSAYLVRGLGLVSDAPEIALRLLGLILKIGAGWLVYCAAARMFDRRTGFWAASAVCLSPIVLLQSGIVPPDAALLLASALIIFAVAHISVGKAKRGTPNWVWVLCGACLGVSLCGGFGALSLLVGLSLIVLARPATDGRLRAMLLMTGVCVLVWLPDVVWRGGQALGQEMDVISRGWDSLLRVGLAALGPVLVLVGPAGAWRKPVVERLLLLSGPGLVGASLDLHAATLFLPPAAILAVCAILKLKRPWILWLALSPGIALALTQSALLAVYDQYGDGLPSHYDPAAEARVAAAFCDRLLNAAEDPRVERIVANSADLAAVCAVQGGLGLSDVGTWPDAGARSWTAPLRIAATDRRVTLIGFLDSDGALARKAFAKAERLGGGYIQSHRDAEIRYAIWLVAGPLDGS